MNSFECEPFEERLQNESESNTHLISAHETSIKNLKCKYCYETFPHNDNLKSHISNVHKIGGQYICKNCGKKFNVKEYLKAHVSTVHDGPKVRCKICDKEFSSKRYLTTHMTLVHEALRRYQCSKCEQTFKSHSNRTRHIT